MGMPNAVDRSGKYSQKQAVTDGVQLIPIAGNCCAVRSASVCCVRTCWHGASSGSGSQFGFGPGVEQARRIQPFGSIGFSIPTGRRLKRQDELHQMQAQMARIETEAKHRELYLELRKLYSRLVLGHTRIALRKQIAESGEKSSVLTRRLVEAGHATALDVGLIELEQARLRTEVFTAETECVEASLQLSQLIGVHAKHFEPLPDPALPQLPEATPALDELQALLIDNHTGLARLRARYEVAERELHLEIAKQYPDFQIGPSYERETAEKKHVLGLTLGIEIPAFDRNQQSIAMAKKRRDEIRIKYEAEANRALATVDRAWRSYQLATEKLKLLNMLVMPKANANIDLARRSMEAGATDSLRLLETERGQRGALLETVEAELAVRAAWIEIEQSIGYPLVLFPSESSTATPPLVPTSEVSNELQKDGKVEMNDD